MSNHINTLKAVVSTLDTIEVKGRGNLNAILGCMQALGGVIANMEQEANAKPTGEEKEDG